MSAGQRDGVKALTRSLDMSECRPGLFSGREDWWHYGQPPVPQGDPQNIWHTEKQCQHDLLPPEHACWVPLLLQPQPLPGQWRFSEKVTINHLLSEAFSVAAVEITFWLLIFHTPLALLSLWIGFSLLSGMCVLLSVHTQGHVFV